MHKQQPKKYSEIKEQWFYRLYRIGFLFISIVALIITSINNNEYRFDWDEWFVESIMWIIISFFAYFILWRSALYVVYGKINFEKQKKEVSKNYNLIKNIGAGAVFLIPFMYTIETLGDIGIALGFASVPLFIYLLLLKIPQSKKSRDVIIVFVLLLLAFLWGLAFISA